MSINVSSYNKSVKPQLKQKASTSSFTMALSLSNKTFKDKDKMLFYKELSGLLIAGVDFKQALEILAEQQSNKQHKSLIDGITAHVVSGKALFEALKDTGMFSPYEYYSIKIGEETRNLKAILPELQRFFERKIQMRRQIVSVFTYPLFVLVLTFGVLYFMMKYVVPMFATVFKQFDKELPELTKKVIYISNHFNSVSIVVVVLIASLLIAHNVFKEKHQYRETLSNIVLRMPFLGALIKKIYITRFSQSLSLLLSAKTPLVNALELVQKMISFYPIEQSLTQVKQDVTKGELFSKALEKHWIYDHKLVSLVSVAEHTNTLDDMFERLAKQYDEETQHQTKMIGVIMEPLIILIIGLVVGTVLIAMYSPMFDLSKILQSN